MKLYRWEVVDTKHGRVYNHIARYRTRRSAERRRERMNARFTANGAQHPGYELRVQKRA